MSSFNNLNDDVLTKLWKRDTLKLRDAFMEAEKAINHLRELQEQVKIITIELEKRGVDIKEIK